MWFKGCPRCGGDVHEAEELEGYEIHKGVHCIQCGHELSPVQALTAARVQPMPAAA